MSGIIHHDKEVRCMLKFSDMKWLFGTWCIAIARSKLKMYINLSITQNNAFLHHFDLNNFWLCSDAHGLLNACLILRRKIFTLLFLICPLSIVSKSVEQQTTNGRQMPVTQIPREALRAFVMRLPFLVWKEIQKLQL